MNQKQATQRTVDAARDLVHEASRYTRSAPDSAADLARSAAALAEGLGPTFASASQPLHAAADLVRVDPEYFEATCYVVRFDLLRLRGPITAGSAPSA